jgi:hypothetical protein
MIHEIHYAIIVYYNENIKLELCSVLGTLLDQVNEMVTELGLPLRSMLTTLSWFDPG